MIINIFKKDLFIFERERESLCVYSWGKGDRGRGKEKISSRLYTEHRA